MKGSEFVLDQVLLLYYKCRKINLNCGGSCISSPDYIKNKEATINPINKKDNKCFQYPVKLALNRIPSRIPCLYYLPMSQNLERQCPKKFIE